MADCINNCASGSKEYAEIGLTNPPSYPQSALWRSPVTIGIDIISKSLIIPDMVSVDLYDLNGGCVDSTGQFYLGLSETKRIILKATMPSKGNLDLRISLSVFWGAIINTWICQDSYSISIMGVDPNATHLVCNGKTKLCVPVPGAGNNLDGCNFVGDPCGGVPGVGTTEPVACTGNDMNLMGICVPKPVVLGAFALAAIYIFKK